MALHAIPQIMPFDYVPKQDRDNDEKTTFKLQPLNGMQHMEVLREIDNEGRFTAKGVSLAIKYGLSGWDNFTDENGKPVPYNALNVSRIPPFILHELGIEIVNRSELGDQERKNS